MRSLIIIALIVYLVVLAIAWHGCQSDRGRTCEQLEVLVWK